MEEKAAALRFIYKPHPLAADSDSEAPKTSYILDYIGMIFNDFIELHGDRLYRDDPPYWRNAYLNDIRLQSLANKRESTKENIYRNFGLSS